MKVIVYPYMMPDVRRHSARGMVRNNALELLFYRFLLRKVQRRRAERRNGQK